MRRVHAGFGRTKHFRVYGVSEEYSDLFKYALGIEAHAEQKGFQWDSEGEYWYCTFEDVMQQVLKPDGSALEEAEIFTADFLLHLVAHAELPESD
jgi:hypothetical protein